MQGLPGYCAFLKAGYRNNVAIAIKNNSSNKDLEERARSVASATWSRSENNGVAAVVRIFNECIDVVTGKRLQAIVRGRPRLADECIVIRLRMHCCECKERDRHSDQGFSKCFHVCLFWFMGK